MKRMMVMASAMLFVFVNFASATPLTPETKLKLEVLRAAIDTWAPMCEGAMSLNRDCYQGDLIEYSGYRCATGDLERCNDIKQAQDVDGRFWRAHRLIGKTDSDSFSRDMFMGLMFYYTTTKDVASLKKWLDYLYSHHSKMCDDANDNRCTLMPSTWGMLGLQMEHQGLPQNGRMKMGRQILPGEMMITAKTAPLGFELELLADNISFLRMLGISASWIRESARILNNRQPFNPVFKYLDEGSTEELGQLLLEACPAEPSLKADDIFWQRQIERNEKGELVVIRDWGDDPAGIPVKSMANGHDCIIALNLAIRSPF